MKRRLAWLLAAGALAALLLTACGAAEAPGAAPSGDMGAAGWGESSARSAGGEDALYAEPQAETPEAVRDAKLIHTGTLELETTEFDRVTAALDALVTDHGGYLESASLRNRDGGYRTAQYTVRVPAERYKDFFTQAGALCHVTWQDQETENVTTRYYDTAGRLKTQQTKLERLQALLARAESMEDIITIESAISETEQAIENLSGELRHYDALVDYATVTISLSEVYKLSGAQEAPVSFPDRVGASFAAGWRAFVNFLEGLAVAAAYGWMWLLLAAAVAVAVLRRRRRKGAGAAPAGKKPPFWTPHRKETDDKGPEG